MVKRKRDHVAVLGAGVAGLTAAHELAERRFDVTVFENRGEAGGKARSMPAGFDAPLADLPAEHGFRFFPGFYRHVPDTMRRIPYKKDPRAEEKTVFDNLVPAERITIARRGAPDIALPAHLPVSPWDLRLVLEAVFRGSNEVSPGDIAYFSERLLLLARACEERRYRELETKSWWEFSGAASRSRSYQKFLADGLTRTLVAARATEMSARTGGYILLQLLSDLTRVGRSVDRVLNGPTSDVWIGPWVEYLRDELGVKFEFDTRVIDIKCEGKHIDRISTRHPASSHAGGEPRGREFDYYVVALPLEVLVPKVVTPKLPGEGLLNDALKEAAGLDELWKLKTRWMNGVLFYLRQDVPICRGHTLYIDSEWALTSISQQQFWRDVDLSQLGDRTIRGILSVDVSDWTTPGTNGKTAMDCSCEEIKQEVWTQLKQHLNDDVAKLLEDKCPRPAYVDQAIEWPNPTEAMNLEPLLVNTAGSWNRRPEAVTPVDNLFLAGDYVRTYTDLATMEGANEAGRRAVNGILEASGSPSEKCGVWPLRDPLALAPVRAADRVWMELEPHARQLWGEIQKRFRLGQP